jgi:hypothetical protein
VVQEQSHGTLDIGETIASKCRQKLIHHKVTTANGRLETGLFKVGYTKSGFDTCCVDVVLLSERDVSKPQP